MLCKAPSVSWAKPTLFVRKPKHFPSKENALLFEQKYPSLRTKKDGSAEGKKFPCARRKISVRTEENFLPQENKFPCGRKYFFLRKEIYLLPHKNLTTLAERNKPLFNNKLNYHDQDQSR